MKPRTPLLVVAAVMLLPRAAAGAEPEAVRFEIDAPRGCVDELAVREEIDLLGGKFRDANLEDRARTFRIEVAGSDDRVTGRLVVRDLVFRETVRELGPQSCIEATRSLALFAATALDEAPPRLDLEASAPESPPPAPWPAPMSETEKMHLERAPRLGSGGFSITGLGSVGTARSAGFRLAAVVRVGGTTRIGLAGTVVQDVRTTERPARREESSGLTPRVGALFGWGAPWNDSIVGFSTEIGVAWGDHRGATTPSSEAGSRWQCGSLVFSLRPCFDETRRAPARWQFLSPYVAPQLVFQVPFKGVAVRPIASLGLLWAPVGPGDSIIAATAETGVVWQAW